MTDCGKTWTPWTLADQDYLIRNAHKPAAEIACHLSKTPAAVRMMKKRLRLVGGAGGTKAAGDRQARLEEYRSLHARGLSDMLIAERMGISEDTTRRYRLELGLKANRWQGAKHWRAQRAKRTNARARECRGRAESLASREDRIGGQDRYFDAEESEFLRAVLSFRGTHGRVPTLEEAYRILLSLGWRKP